MADQQAITAADVESLAEKLKQFNQTLTPGELAALSAVVLRGMAPAEDVAGYIQGPGGPAPFPIGDPPGLGSLGAIFTTPLPGAGHGTGPGPH